MFKNSQLRLNQINNMVHLYAIKHSSKPVYKPQATKWLFTVYDVTILQKRSK